MGKENSKTTEGPSPVGRKGHRKQTHDVHVNSFVHKHFQCFLISASGGRDTITYTVDEDMTKDVTRDTQRQTNGLYNQGPEVTRLMALKLHGRWLMALLVEKTS